MHRDGELLRVALYQRPCLISLISTLQPIRKVPEYALRGCISLPDDFPDRLLAIRRKSILLTPPQTLSP